MMTGFGTYLTFAVLVAGHGPALAADAASPYDGAWRVTLSCPPHHDDEDAKGYVHPFPADIKAGFLQGTHGVEGEPGWHFLSGSIAPDGTANLTLRGIVNNAEYAVGGGQRGKRYAYRVRARFEPNAGSGERVGKRKCDLRFGRT